MNPSAPYRPAGSLELASALDPYSGPWDERRAAHLLRRAGFGGTPDEVARYAARSPRDAVDSLVHFPPNAGKDDRPSGLPDISEYMRIVRDLRSGAITMQEARRELARPVLTTQLWWLGRMMTTPAPLQEKMVLFWHGHFTSQVLAKTIMAQDMVVQNQLFRQYALGNVRALTQAIARDPAMLKYLDNARSVKAHPNENFARELMELFTLGIGNYTEQDVRESARAFTGWTVRRDEFAFNSFAHDDGRKTFLGRTGNLDGGDIIDTIFQQPAAARWFSRKLLGYFVYDDPEPELVDAVAGQMRKSDYNLLPVVSTLLRSNVFFSERAYRALVKSPVEFVVGSYRLMGVAAPVPRTVVALRSMGQVPLSPPSVKGWDGGISWLNSQTVLSRENFASELVNSPMMPSDSWVSSTPPGSAGAVAQHLVGTILQGDASAASVSRIVSYLGGSDTTANGMLSGENFPERVRGAAYLAMAMPAYQLN